MTDIWPPPCGCNGKCRKARGERLPHGVRCAGEDAEAKVCKTCGNTGREPVMIAGEWGIAWGSANCSACGAPVTAGEAQP